MRLYQRPLKQACVRRSNTDIVGCQTLNKNTYETVEEHTMYDSQHDSGDYGPQAVYSKPRLRAWNMFHAR